MGRPEPAVKRCKGCEERAEYIRRAADAFKAWVRNPVGMPPNPLNLPLATPHSTALGQDQKEHDESSEK